MREGVWKLGRAQGTRSARKLDGALMLLRTFYLVDFINEMARDNKTSTLRELYYISEGWEESKFHSEDESNLLIEDLEVLFLPVAANLRNADPAQEEVARSLGLGRVATFWRVTLGQARLAGARLVRLAAS